MTSESTSLAITRTIMAPVLFIAKAAVWAMGGALLMLVGASGGYTYAVYQTAAMKPAHATYTDDPVPTMTPIPRMPTAAPIQSTPAIPDTDPFGLK